MRTYLLVGSVVLQACSGSDSTDSVDSGDTATAVAVPAFGADMEPEFTVVATSEEKLSNPTDLGFHPRRDEVWVVNQATDAVVIVDAPGTEDQSSVRRKDAYANHFMEEVSSIAWGVGSEDTDGEEAFGTCQESRNTYDGQGMPNNFMGPVLWPGDREIFAKANQNSNQLLGSHLDMLHASPNCMGMAHDEGNAFWVFDGWNKHLVYYDFQADHGPGGDFHGDGIIRRYIEVELDRKANVPGHLIKDQESGLLYIADTGNGRVIEVDTATGEITANLPQTTEALQEFSQVEGVSQRDLVSGLSKPSGIVLDGDILFVGDWKTGEILAFDLEGGELGRIQTPAEGLMGLEIGPEGKLWYVDGAANELVRVDP